MNRILSNDDLIPEQWHWIRTKGGLKMWNGNTTKPGEFKASKVGTASNGIKYIADRIWCDPTNDQALAIYEIYGLIQMPNVLAKRRRSRPLERRVRLLPTRRVAEVGSKHDLEFGMDLTGARI